MEKHVLKGKVLSAGPDYWEVRVRNELSSGQFENTTKLKVWLKEDINVAGSKPEDFVGAEVDCLIELMDRKYMVSEVFDLEYPEKT